MARQRGIVVPISATDNTERAFQEVNARIAELQQRLRAAEAGARGLGQGLGDGMSHAVPQVAAASGAIREFEGNLPIRAVERFLTTTLGLGPALSAAFPLVGAIAFVGVVSEGVDKLYELYKTGTKAAVEIDRAFEELRAKLQLSNDELDLQNAKLQQEIDKIEGHPNNGIQVALDEAKVSADRLLISLQADIKALDELLKAHEVGTFSSLLTGVVSNKELDKQIKDDGEKLADTAADATHKLNEALSAAGDLKDDAAKKDAIKSANKAYFDALDKNFGDFIAKYKQKSKDFRDEQIRSAALSRQAQELGGARVGSISAVDNSANIAGADAAVRDAQLLRDRLRSTQTNGNLVTQLGEDRGNKADSGRAERLNAAMKEFADSQRKAAEQAAQAVSDAAKRQSADELAALDDKHKRQLISDRDYYAQKAAIQTQALDSEANAISSKQGAIDEQIRGLIADRGKSFNDSAAITKDDAKILELQTQVNVLEEQRLKLVQQRKDVALQAGTDDYLAEKKVSDEALKTAAELEALRGGSTSARLDQSRSQFSDRLRSLRGNGVNTSNAESIQGISEGELSEKSASATYQSQSSDLTAQRSRISYEERAGLISSADAQQQKIALDQQEAAALGPLIAAYQKLADLGVQGASAKVDELKEKVLELNAPIDEVASHLRSQLDGAFETLFDNLDRGARAWEKFGESIQKAFLGEAYKRIVEPGVQVALGAVIPNGIGGGRPAPSAPGGIGAALGGLIPGLAKIPGIGVKGGGAGDITVQIINQGSPLTSGGAQQQTSGGSGDDFEQRVVSIILKDAETNGSAIQAILGAIQNG